MALYLRADFKHSGYWTSGTVLLSDGFETTFPLQEFDGPQTVSFDDWHTIEWIVLDRLIKAETTSPYQSLRLVGGLRARRGINRYKSDPSRRVAFLRFVAAQYSPLMTKNELRMVPARADFCLANLNLPFSSAGTSIPSDNFSPTARFFGSFTVYMTMSTSPSLKTHR